MAGIAVALFVFMQLLGSLTVRIFVDDASVIALGRSGLCLTSWFYLFLGMIYVSRGIQNGVGDAVFAFINGIIEVTCRILLPRLLILLPGADVHVIWWTVGLTWVFSGACCLMRYLGWQRRHSNQGGSPFHRHNRKKERFSQHSMA